MLSFCPCSLERASFAFVRIPLSLGPKCLKMEGCSSFVDIEGGQETFWSSKAGRFKWGDDSLVEAWHAGTRWPIRLDRPQASPDNKCCHSKSELFYEEGVKYISWACV